LQSLFLRQIQLLRESALAHFKSATTSEEMPSDFAFSTAHTLSSRATDESKRPGSGWSYNKESTDPQNTTQEIATQRKRLLSSQVGTAQQHANATRRRPRVPTEAVRRGQRKGVPNDPGEHDAAVRRDVPGELRLAAAVAGLAVLEAAAKSIAGVLEMVGAWRMWGRATVETTTKAFSAGAVPLSDLDPDGPMDCHSSRASFTTSTWS
jgi:hypothetical protein